MVKRNVREDRTYSDKELDAMITKMKDASAVFYWQATQTGCHSFIEFAGLMNEFIKICENTKKAGVDFTLTNVHGSNNVLTVHDYNINYLYEKLECIYGKTISDQLVKRLENAD